MNPTFFWVDCHVTVVPVFTQKSSFPFAFGMLGVTEDESEVRLTSTLHGVEADPHVLSALHRLAGFACEQAFLLLSFLLSAAVAKLATSRMANGMAE